MFKTESLIVKGICEDDLKKLISGGKKINKKADCLVEYSLLAKAAGFYYEEQEVSLKKEVFYENGKKVREVSEPVVLNVQRYRPAEFNAQVFWLVNRKPDEWKDKKELKQTDTDNKLGEIRIIDDILIDDEKFEKS